MTRAELARILDHSVLKPESTQADIQAGIDAVRALGVGFYCVQPCWVKLAASALAGTDARSSASSDSRTDATCPTSRRKRPRGPSATARARSIW